MREALSALTNRGRAFVAAGAAAVLCAVALGYPSLTRVGGLLVLLPVMSAFFVGRGRYRLGLVRSLSPTQVSVGQPARVQLELSNDGRMPTGLLLLEEHIPYVLGTRPRFVINRMGPRWTRTVDYAVRSDVRGKFTVGPMSVRLSDPFGLIELDRTFVATSSLVVTPRVAPLPAIPLSGAWSGAGDNRPRAFSTGSSEDVTVREYRHGDELRRVHWRTSAKAGELMVRREEQPWQSRATLFLDNRSAAHRGNGAASSLEQAIAITASVAVHLVQRGFRVRLVTATGEEEGAAWHDHGAVAVETAPLLESLAVLDAASLAVPDVRWLQDAGHSGLLVAVLGALEDRDKPAVRRIKHSATTALAIALDVGAWTRGGGSPADGRATTWLASTGFRAVSCAPGDQIATVWQQLAHIGSGRRSSAAASRLASRSADAVGGQVS